MDVQKEIEAARENLDKLFEIREEINYEIRILRFYIEGLKERLEAGMNDEGVVE